MNWILFLTLVIAAGFVPYAATEECVGSTESLCPSKRRTPSPNPFEKGCLLTIAEERNETELLLHKDKNRFQTVERICNSNDVADGLDQCYNENDHRYEEIRIAIGDWDSTIFISWIMQIILSVSKRSFSSFKTSRYYERRVIIISSKHKLLKLKTRTTI